MRVENSKYFRHSKPEPPEVSIPLTFYTSFPTANFVELFDPRLSYFAVRRISLLSL